MIFPMKKSILIALFAILGTSAYAQIEAAFTYGYRFGGRLPVRYDNQFGELRANSSDAFGVDLRYDLGQGGTRLMAAYSRQITRIDFVGNGFFDREEFLRVAVEYITLGIMRGSEFRQGINPFGGASFGMAILTPRENNLSQEIRIGINLQGGVNYFITEKVGVRMSVGMYAPLMFAGVGIFCGGGGCNTGVNAGSTILQGDLSAGVVVRLGGDNKPPQQPRQASPNATW